MYCEQIMPVRHVLGPIDNNFWLGEVNTVSPAEQEINRGLMHFVLSPFSTWRYFFRAYKQKANGGAFFSLFARINSPTGIIGGHVALLSCSCGYLVFCDHIPQLRCVHACIVRKILPLLLRKEFIFVVRPCSSPFS